jgi:subtilisin family serine protease
MPEVLFAQASPRSVGGASLLEAPSLVTQDTVGAFLSEDELVHASARRLGEAGFQVLQITRTTINIAAPPELYEEVFGNRLETEEREVIKGGAREDTATFVDTPDTPVRGLIATEGSDLGELLEGVAIEEPVYPHQNAFPPPVGYWHLDVPGDVAAALGAERAHRRGVTGRNVSLAMVDTGWFRHPYFGLRGYRSSPVVLGPAAADAEADESGHGTGESANAFAAAPDIDFTMVKMNFVNSTGAFNTAVSLSPAPQVITCSWGSSVRTGPLSAANQALAAAIAAAVASGIVVVFSAGNGHWGFPGQHPDVLSAGGVFMEADGSMRASDYASGFASQVYPGRNVPDVSGLVGMLPRAAYIMLPLQPGDEIDQDLGGGTFPAGDETATDDGWAAFSGTSAAAPQLAGVCALVRQACPRLTPAEVRDVLMRTARDVTTGTNALGNAAGPGYDLATGAGLVDADRAVMVAKLRCRGIRPIEPPIRPPIEPGPIQPIDPGPIRPPRPPIQPIQVRPKPVIPPPGPIDPAPIRPVGLESAAFSGPQEGQGMALSHEDVEALEDLIIETEVDPEL